MPTDDALCSIPPDALLTPAASALTVPVAVVAGAARRIVAANAAWSRLAPSVARVPGGTLDAAFPNAAAAAEVALRGAGASGLALRAVPASTPAGEAPGWWDLDLLPHPEAPGALIVTARDVTEEVLARRDAEGAREALDATSARLRLATEAAGIGTWEWDLPGDRLTWSPEQFRLHGLDPARDRPPGVAEWLGWIHPEDRAGLLAASRGLREPGAYFQAELRLRRPGSEEWRWLLTRGQVAQASAEGTPRRILGVALDITSRRREQEAVRESEARLRLAFEVAGFFTWDWDIASGRVVWSAGAEAMQGLPEGSFGGSIEAFRSLVHLEDLPRVEAALARALAGETPDYRVEFRMRRGDGSLRWTATRAVVLRDAAGNAVRMVGVDHDITERRTAEEALAAERARLMALLDVLPTGVIIAEPPDGRMALANAPNRQLFGVLDGITLAESNRRSPRLGPGGQPIPLEDLPLARALWCGETVRGAAARLVPADAAAPRDLLISAAPVRDAEGRILAAVAAFQDVTEARAAEALVRGVLDSLPAHVAVLDARGVVLMVNAAWDRFARENGGAAGVSVGADYLAICRAASRAGDAAATAVLEGLEALIAGGRDTLVLEYSCPAPDRERWYLMHAARAAGVGAAVVLSHVEITALKRAERAAASGEARLRQAQRVGRVGGFEIELAGGLPGARNRRSAEYMALHGLPARETMERHEDWVRRLHPEDRARAEACFLHAISDASGATDYGQEYRVVSPSGEVRWISARAEIERDPASGRALRVLGAHVDVTGLKQAEAALDAAAEEHARLAAIVASTSDAIISFDAADGRIRTWNAGAEALFGYTAAEATGAPVGLLLPPDIAAAEPTGVFARALAGKRVHEEAAERLAKGGERIPVSITAARMVDAKGRVLGVSGIFRDMRAARAAEAALARQARLQAALLEVSRLVLEGGRDEAALAELVFARMGPLLKADLCLAYRLEPGGEALSLVAAPGLAAPAREAARRLRLGEAFCGAVAASRAPVSADAARIAAEPQGAFLHGLGARAYACHPLMDREGGLLGTFSLASTRRDGFDAEETAVLQALCDILALAWQRLRAEAALREGEALLRLSQEAGGVGSFMRDVAEGTVTVSEGYGRLFGLAPGRRVLCEAEWLEMVHPEDRAHMQARVRATIGAGAAEFTADYRIIRPTDGAVRHIEARARCERDAEGRPWRIWGLHLDVTERRAAERALAASEARFRSFVEASTPVIWTMSPEGEVAEPIPAWQAYTGQEFGQARGLGFLEAIHPEDRPAVLQAWRRAVTEGDTYQASYRLRRHDGAWRRVLARGAPVRDAEGRTLEWIGTCTDVTESREAEDALRESEARYRALAEINPGFVFEADAAGLCTYTNRRFQDYAGVPAEALLGTGWIGALHPEDRDRAARVWAEAVRTGGPYEIEYRFRRADGTHRWFLCRGAPQHGPDGAILRWFGAAVDITEIVAAREAAARQAGELEQRVAARTRALADAAGELAAEMRRREEAQAALLQAQKLEALGQLTGGVAHDFNNVLAAVTGSYRLIRRHAGNDPRIAELVGHGERAAERAIGLIRQLMAFARKEELAPAVIAPAAAVQAAEDMVRHTAGRGVRCVFELAADAWPVIADRMRLETVLLNLAANARDAMPAGGTLRVAVDNAAPEEVPPELAAGRGFVRIAVEDTGLGMDAETLRRATEPFFTTKPPGRGTGLGLASAHGFAAQSGGMLALRSAPGEGTCVALFLPRAAVLPAVDASPEPSDAASQNWLDRTRHGGATLLVVDDDDGVRPVTAAVLRGLGYRVVEAPSAEAAEALAHLGGERIDMLVTDVVMGGAPGPALAARLRAELPDLPVLYITGHAGGMALRDAPVLRKPFSEAALARAVLEGLGRAGQPAGGAGAAPAVASRAGEKLRDRLRTPALRDAYLRWLSLRGGAGGPLPGPAALDAASLPEATRSRGFLAEVVGETGFRYLQMGSVLEEQLGRSLVGTMAGPATAGGADPTDPLASIGAVYARCARTRAPVYDYAQVSPGDGGPPLRLERLVLPLSADGVAVTHVAGVVNLGGARVGAGT